MYNQQKFTKDDTNICWAITSSELIDAYRAAHGDDQHLTSPLSIALDVQATRNVVYLKHFSDPAWQMPYPYKKPDLSSDEKIQSEAKYSVVFSGDVSQGIETIRGLRVCDQRFLHDLIDMEGDQTKRATKKYLNGKRESVHDYFYSVLALIKAKREAIALTEQAFLRVARGIDTNSARCGSKFFENVSGITDALKAAVQADPDGNYTAVDVQAFTENYCRAHEFKVDVPSPKTLFFKSIYHPTAAMPDDIMRQIHASLTSGQPVGISIKSCLLKGAEACLHPFGNTDMSHAILISGQRKAGRSCQYLLRNSYGASCKDEKGNPKYPYPCEKGSIWVDETALMDHSLDITWLPQK